MYNYEIDICYNTFTEYQTEFLKVFGLNDWDNDVISSGRTQLYFSLKKEPYFEDLFSYACKNNFLQEKKEDTEWGLVRLFAEEVFYEFHMCVKDYFKHKKVSDTTILHMNKVKELLDIL